MSHGQITDAAQARKFIVGGNCRLTLVSLKTNARYTYRVQKAPDGEIYFVHLLVGADNESDFQYIGMISGPVFRTTSKSKLRADSLPVMAFAFAMRCLFLQAPAIPSSLQIWHEGRCARCNRALTVPASIASGFGPECAKAA